MSLWSSPGTMWSTSVPGSSHRRPSLYLAVQTPPVTPDDAAPDRGPGVRQADPVGTSVPRHLATPSQDLPLRFGHVGEATHEDRDTGAQKTADTAFKRGDAIFVYRFHPLAVTPEPGHRPCPRHRGGGGNRLEAAQPAGGGGGPSAVRVPDVSSSRRMKSLSPAHGCTSSPWRGCVVGKAGFEPAALRSQSGCADQAAPYPMKQSPLAPQHRQRLGLCGHFYV